MDKLLPLIKCQVCKSNGSVKTNPLTFHITTPIHEITNFTTSPLKSNTLPRFEYKTGTIYYSSIPTEINRAQWTEFINAKFHSFTMKGIFIVEKDDR